ncbi:ABC transporter [Zhihengliuella alba]|uniref:ABC transporter n=1 Tax=Zhihengliuella alba TaxID=547018 RepID=UPI0031E7C351
METTPPPGAPALSGRVPTGRVPSRRPVALFALAAAAVLATAGCSAGVADPGGNETGNETGSESGQEAGADAEAGGHGSVEGAQQVGEPQVKIASVDAAGAVGLHDLLTGESTELDPVGKPQALASGGRYLFVTTEAGLEVVDSGVWTWDHVDHFHYYRSDPRPVGAVAGEGESTVSTSSLPTAGSTGVFFQGSHEAVLLDNEALSEGAPEERFRIGLPAHRGLVAPVGAGALVTVPDASGTVAEVQYYDAEGSPVEGVSAACPAAEGTITTRVGVVVGCLDGAVLATVDADGKPALEHVPYPEGTEAPPATAFANRKGRPTVAALAGEGEAQRGVWLLDTRERVWELLPAPEPLVKVAAVDDADTHVVALGASGRLHVLTAGPGEEAPAVVGSTEALAAAPDGGALTADTPGLDLVVDQQRAYVNDPASGVVHEIAYNGEARLARTLETPVGADFFTEVGR